MIASSFEQWFATLTGHGSPHPWQRALADEASCRDRLIRIPTGLGKTKGVLAAWSYHRIGQADDRWPRRLIWCLPMRVLVEQTEQVARDLASKMPASQRPESATLQPEWLRSVDRNEHLWSRRVWDVS